MLADFFHLNQPFQECPDVAHFRAALNDNPQISGMQYTPAELKNAPNFRTIEDKNFLNVSFSKTKITDLRFRNCQFEDCLFVDTEFVKCTFQHCVFKQCNLYKASFENTYVDPDAFRYAMTPPNYANIGVGLFQSLSRDLANQNQHELRAKAEFQFERWLRFQLRHDMEAQYISQYSYPFRYVWRLFFELAAGYGWKPIRLACTILVSYVVFFVLNYALWDSYGIRTMIPGVSQERGIINAFYYTTTLLTTLGPMGLAPTTTTGLVFASLHAVAGILLFALLASLIFKVIVKSA